MLYVGSIVGGFVLHFAHAKAKRRLSVTTVSSFLIKARYDLTHWKLHELVEQVAVFHQLSMKSESAVVLFLSLVVVLSQVTADFGPCTFASDRCSCRIGSANQGKCWDHRRSVPGTCSSRFCKRGWTCSCGDRTHLCYLEGRTTIIIDPADKNKDIASCPLDPATGVPFRRPIAVASGPEISLGTLQYDVSPKGSAADDCNQVCSLISMDPVQRAINTLLRGCIAKKANRSFLSSSESCFYT